MSPTDPTLASFVADLKRVVKTDDAARLAEFLSGRNLPALGGDQEPADVIYRGIAQEPALATAISPLLAVHLRQEAESLQGLSDTEEVLRIEPRRRSRLINSFLLATELPAEPVLFSALLGIRNNLPADSPALIRSLNKALVYQQTDDYLEQHWLHSLSWRNMFASDRSEDEEVWLNAWLGLLWIPPQNSGEIPELNRIERGLLKLQELIQHCENGAQILQYALEVLCETYPRSSQFWESSFEPRLGNWPENLQEEMFRRWPRLRQSSEREGSARSQQAHAAEVRQAQEANLPIEGLVTGLNERGVEVQVFGMRAFCPLSQLDLRYVENPQQFVGQKLLFKVNRLEEGNRGSHGPKILLSRRSLLEEEQQARAAETREKLQVGAVLTGRVTSLTTYGAFIDLGGIEGMLHVSEIGHRRITHPQDVFTIGQEVEVQVIRIEQGKDEKRPERISLSRRALERDPWQDAAARFPEGTEATGRVMRLETFGAFVELAPGLEGLVHISEMGAGRRLNHSREAAEQGQEVQVRVLGVDTGRRRISLSMNIGTNAGVSSGMGAASGMVPGGGGGGEPRGDRRRGGGGGRQQDFARSDRSRGERGGFRGDEDAYARSGASAPTESGFGSMADFFSRLKKG